MTAMPLLVLVLTCGAALVVAAPPAPPRGGEIPRRRSPRVHPGTAGPLEVARLVERLATVIASGVAPRPAWAAVAATVPAGPLRELAAAVGAGADPRSAAPRSLRAQGEVAALGAALSLCERTGAPTGPMLETLAAALRDVADAALARRSALAGPAATARILLALPLAGVGLGMLLGADPIGRLTHGGGRVMLVIGLALACLGWWWMRRLVQAAQSAGVSGVDPSIVLGLAAGPLAAGAPLALSLRAVAAALGDDPAAPALDRAGAALAAGAGAATALAGLPDALGPLREAALVGESTGADLVGLLRSAAADQRRGRARDAEAAAARLAVRLVLPTGLALLPAFVALGIIPTVASLLGGSFPQVLG